MTKTLDIHSKGERPSAELSNFYPHAFEFDGVSCASMEGFLQSLKFKSKRRQRRVCSAHGKRAKKYGKHKFLWKLTGRVHWQGRAIERRGEDFSRLISRAYAALYEQSEAFRSALDSTKGMILVHTIGSHDKGKTILTEEEFIACLLSLRDGQ